MADINTGAWDATRVVKGSVHYPKFPASEGYIGVQWGTEGGILGTPNIYHVFKSGGGWHNSYIINKDYKMTFRALVGAKTEAEVKLDFPLHDIAPDGSPLEGLFINSRQIVKSESVTQVSVSAEFLDNCEDEGSGTGV